MSSQSTMLKALLGLAVVAGWQNRDKIGDFVKNMSQGGGVGDLLGKLGGAVGGATQNPAGGLGGLVDQLKKAGLGEKADSWVSTGPNKPITEPEMEKGIGGDVVDELAKQVGIPRDELLKRLTQVLPEMVDKMTPAGKIPA